MSTVDFAIFLTIFTIIVCLSLIFSILLIGYKIKKRDKEISEYRNLGLYDEVI